MTSIRAEVTSALKLMQKVILSVADYKMDPYIVHVSTFNAYEGTVDANYVKAGRRGIQGGLAGCSGYSSRAFCSQRGTQAARRTPPLGEVCSSTTRTILKQGGWGKATKADTRH